MDRAESHTNAPANYCDLKELKQEIKELKQAIEHLTGHIIALHKGLKEVSKQLNQIPKGKDSLQGSKVTSRIDTDASRSFMKRFFGRRDDASQSETLTHGVNNIPELLHKLKDIPGKIFCRSSTFLEDINKLWQPLCRSFPQGEWLMKFNDAMHQMVCQMPAALDEYREFLVNCLELTLSPTPSMGAYNQGRKEKLIQNLYSHFRELFKLAQQNNIATDTVRKVALEGDEHLYSLGITGAALGVECNLLRELHLLLIKYPTQVQEPTLYQAIEESIKGGWQGPQDARIIRYREIGKRLYTAKYLTILKHIHQVCKNAKWLRLAVQLDKLYRTGTKDPNIQQRYPKPRYQEEVMEILRHALIEPPPDKLYYLIIDLINFFQSELSEFYRQHESYNSIMQELSKQLDITAKELEHFLELQEQVIVPHQHITKYAVTKQTRYIDSHAPSGTVLAITKRCFRLPSNGPLYPVKGAEILVSR